MQGRRFVALAAAALVTVAGCTSGNGNGKDPGQKETRSARPKVKQTGMMVPDGGVFDRAEAKATLRRPGKKTALDVLSIQRVAPKKVVARFRLRNIGDPPITGGWSVGDTDHVIYQDWSYAFNAVYLADLRGRELSVPLQRSDGKCACTYYGTLNVTQGEAATFWAAYPVSRTSRAVSATLGSAGITDDIPIAAKDAPLPRVPGEPTANELAGTDAPTYPLSLYSYSENKRVKSSGREVTVELPSDVLFEFGKATLTGAARAQLRRVSERLRAEASGPVSITGYTDSVGSRQENLTLSEQRARAVAKELRPRLRGQDLTFTVTGKGEANPVAENRVNGADNPEGRAKNRRVEIAYERTVQGDSTTATPKPEQSEDTRLGTVRSGSKLDNGVVLHLNKVRRMPGGTALVRFTAVNNGSQTAYLDQYSDELFEDGYDSHWIANYQGKEVFWVALRGSDGTTYHPVNDSSGSCLCSDTPYLGLEQGESVRLWVLTSAPSDAEKVGVTFANYGTVKNVPLPG